MNPYHIARHSERTASQTMSDGGIRNGSIDVKVIIVKDRTRFNGPVSKLRETRVPFPRWRNPLRNSSAAQDVNAPSHNVDLWS